MRKAFLLRCNTCGFYLSINEACKTYPCPNYGIDEQLTLIEGSKYELNNLLKGGLKMETTYKQNDTLYLCNGTQFMKCKIDEIIVHQTQKETIVKYIVRPYGYDKFVTVEEKDLVNTLQEAYDRTKEYCDNITATYYARLEKCTEEYFEIRENEYQLSLENKKEEKDVS